MAEITTGSFADWQLGWGQGQGRDAGKHLLKKLIDRLLGLMISFPQYIVVCHGTLHTT